MGLRVGRWIERVTLFLVLLCVIAPAAAAAQACPAGKYCFYVPPGLPFEGSHSTAGSRAFDIVLSAPVRAVTGTYAVGAGAMASFRVSPGASVRIPLAGAVGRASGYGIAEQNGVFLVADSQDLTVDHREVFDSEQYSETIKRHSIALGTRFRLGGYSLNREGFAGSGVDAVLIYAPTGGSITLTAPPGATLPFWADSATATTTVTLGAGQTLAVRTRIGRDLDGGLLTATQPVSVSTGGRGWSVGVCGDDGMDGLVPVSALGTQYVVRLPTASTAVNNESRVRVIADVDGTEVRVNGTLVATLAAGAFHGFQPVELSYIETSQPALVWMNAALDGCELDTVLIPPVAFASALTSLSLDFNVLASTQPAELALLIATRDVSSVRLDGNTPTLVANMVVPGRPELSYVRFNVGAGDHNVRADSDFQAMLASRTQPSGLLAYYNPFRIPGCGDAGADPGETCDDGNVTDGDGCSSICQLEPGWLCTGSPSACATSCGDGRVGLPTESCDDGNPLGGDGCNTTCRAEVAITAPPDGTATTDATPTISGTADVGATVMLSVGDATGMALADAAGTWSFTVPTPLGDGMRAVTATSLDLRGGRSSALRTLIIDTSTTLTITAPLEGAVTRDTTPIFAGTGELGSSVDVRVGGASVGTTTVRADGTWELTPLAPLAEGPQSFSAIATDALSNMVATPIVRFSIDAATSLTIGVPEPGSTIANAMPTLSGTGEPGAMVALTLRDAAGTEVSATARVMSDATWSVTVAAPLANGLVTVAATATDSAGNTAQASTTFGIDADTFVRIESPLADEVVRGATPVVVIIAEPGARMALRLDDFLLASGQVSADGRVEVPITTPLPDGVHRLLAEATAESGVRALDMRSFEVDTRTEVELTAPLGGAVLDSATPPLSGVGEPGAGVEVRIDGEVVGTATVGADGRWSVLLTVPLFDGAHTARVRTTDRAGNEATREIAFQVDTRPDLPLIEINNPPDAAFTRDAQPALTGIAGPSAHVIVVLDGMLLDTVRSTASGSWSVRLLSTLPPGEHKLLVTTTDQLRVIANDQHVFTIDADVAPLSLLLPVDGTVTRGARPTISGIAPAGATVQVFVDGSAIGESVAGQSGAWSLAPTAPLADGRHAAHAVVTDGPAPATVAVGFHVDTRTSVAVELPARDGVVGNPTPMLAGTAEPGARLWLSIDGSDIGRTEASIAGTWQLAAPRPLAPGPHRLLVRARDALGNEATDESGFTFDERALDSDGDGRSDAPECGVEPCGDSDGDGLTDERDADDDGDGLSSASECMRAPCVDHDGDGRPDVLDQDDDNDTRPSFEERASGGGPRDSDGDGVPDHLDADDDGDSSPTRDECASTPCPDTDGNGLPNYLDPDDDGDGLPTARELADATNLGSDDDDRDGLPNWFDADANDNGVPDAIDGIIDADGDGLPDYADLDTSVSSIDITEDDIYNIAGGAGCSVGAGPASRHELSTWLLALAALARRRRRARRA